MIDVFDILPRRLKRNRAWLSNGFVISEHYLQPDVSVSFPNQAIHRGWRSSAPTPNQLEPKKDLYLANGAHEVWLVYDQTQTTRVHHPGGRAIRYTDRFVSHALETEISIKEVFAVEQ